MLLNELVSYCDIEYTKHHNEKSSDCLKCRNVCQHDCKKCLEYIHYPQRRPFGGKDDYNCPNIINFYICAYAYRYASEILRFLETDVFNDFFVELHRFKITPNILSLGCGGCPDLMAFETYFDRCQYMQSVTYRGVEKNPLWGNIHRQIKQYCEDNTRIEPFFNITNVIDFLDEMEHHSVDILIIQYLISTFFNSGRANEVDTLFKLIVDKVVKYKNPEAPMMILITDVNLNTLGRDMFMKLVQLIEREGFETEVNRFHYQGAFSYGNYYSDANILYPLQETLYDYQPWEICNCAQIAIIVRSSEEIL